MIDSQDSASLWWPRRHSAPCFCPEDFQRFSTLKFKYWFCSPAHGLGAGYQDEYSSVLALEKLPVEGEGEK